MQDDSHEGRLQASSIELPEPLPPFGQYVPSVLRRDTLWVGGHFGTRADGAILTGRCGDGVTADEARVAARSAAINLLATVRTRSVRSTAWNRSCTSTGW